MGGTLYTCGRFMLMYGKKHYNIVIILQTKKKKKEKKTLYLNHTLKRFPVYLIWNWTWVLHVFSVPSVVFFVYANCMVIH